MDWKRVSSSKEIANAWAQGARAVGLKSGTIAATGMQPNATKPVDFPILKDMLEVDAEVLRECILNSCIGTSRKQLYLRGVHVKGRLSLEGFRSSETAAWLPELKFVQCYFSEGACFSGARLAGLSMAGCRLGVPQEQEQRNSTDYGETLVHLNMNNVFVDGDLNISHMHPLRSDSTVFGEDSDPSLIASIRQASIRGSLVAGFSKFASSIATNPRKIDGSPRTPLDICNAHIFRDLQLTPQVVVYGGIDAKGLICHGEAWLTGGEYHAERIDESDTADKQKHEEEGQKNPRKNALDFQSARFGTNLVISLNDRDNEDSRALQKHSAIKGAIKFLGTEATDVYMQSTDMIRTGDPESDGIFCDNSNFRRLDITELKHADSDKRNPHYLTLGHCKVGSLIFETKSTNDEFGYTKAVIFNASDIDELKFRGSFDRGVGLSVTSTIGSVDIDVSGGVLDLANTLVTGSTRILFRGNKISLNDTNFQSNVDIRLGRIDREAVGAGQTSSQFDASRLDHYQWATLEADSCRARGVASIQISGSTITGTEEELFRLQLDCLSSNMVIGGLFEKIDLAESEINGRLDLNGWRTPYLAIDERQNEELAKSDSDKVNWPTLVLRKSNLAGRLTIGDASDYSPINLRQYKLSCYPGCTLVSSEAQKTNKNDLAGTRSGLHNTSSLIVPTHRPEAVPDADSELKNTIDAPTGSWGLSIGKKIRAKLKSRNAAPGFPDHRLIRLTGRSPVFHDLNSRLYGKSAADGATEDSSSYDGYQGLLDISTPEKAAEYLALFCAYVWGEEGPFQIVTAAQLERLTPPDRLNPHPDRKDIGFINCQQARVTSDSKTEKAASATHNEEQSNRPYFSNITIYPGSGIEELREALIRLKSSATFSDGTLSLATRFEEEIRKQLKPVEDDGDRDISKSEEAEKNSAATEVTAADSKEHFRWFATATVFYDGQLINAVFAMRRDPAKHGLIEMIGDSVVCDARISGTNSNTEIGEQEESTQRSEWHCPVATFDSYQRGSGAARLGATSSPPVWAGDLSTEEWLPRMFDTFLPADFFTRDPNSNPAKEYQLANLTWGMSRTALVDLRDCHCGLLEDDSGSGWGENVYFWTDRFEIDSIAKRETIVEDTVQKDRSSWNLRGKSNPGQFSIARIMKCLEVAPDTKLLLAGAINGEQPAYSVFLGDQFVKQRLLWLSHYHSAFARSDRPALEVSSGIDSGSFQRFARTYRKLGLQDEAKYLDEARIRSENKQFRRSLLTQDRKVEFRRCLQFAAAAAACMVISYAAGLNAWALVAFLVVLSALSWNVVGERVLRSVWYGGSYLSDKAYWLGFRYGLSLPRPVFTILLMILVGWWGAQLLSDRGYLVAETTIVTSNVNSGMGYVVADFPSRQSHTKVSDIPCGSNVDHGLYALDLFIPLIELDQDDRCLLRPYDPEPRVDYISGQTVRDRPYRDMWSAGFFEFFRIFFQHPTTWRVAQALYILLGWVVISMSLLTFSGYFRRQAEGDG